MTGVAPLPSIDLGVSAKAPPRQPTAAEVYQHTFSQFLASRGQDRANMGARIAAAKSGGETAHAFSRFPKMSHQATAPQAAPMLARPMRQPPMRQPASMPPTAAIRHLSAPAGPSDPPAPSPISAGASANATPAADKNAVDKPAPAHGGLTFHEVLSSLNPLQYIPIVGTIYRSATGDTIPENTRMAGSLVVSGLTGGPIGILTNVAATMIERLTGLDPEKMGASLLARIGIGRRADSPTAVAANATPPRPAEPPASHPAAPPRLAAMTRAQPPVPASGQTQTPTHPLHGMTQKQLAAYGVTRAPDGSLRRGDIHGADVLNTIELAYLSTANAGMAATAYRAAPRSSPPA